MIIGITGSIATGKSSVLKYLENQGFPVVDSDKIVHSLLGRPDIKDKIMMKIGRDILSNNNIDRKKLGKIVFQNASLRKKLNKIIHPEVILEIQELTKEYQRDREKFVFVEIPLLFEESLEYLVEKIILVYAPREVQIQRLISRDGISEAYAMEKIKAGMDIEEKVELADYLIKTNMDFASVHRQIEEILRRLKDEI